MAFESLLPMWHNAQHERRAGGPWQQRVYHACRVCLGSGSTLKPLTLTPFGAPRSPRRAAERGVAAAAAGAAPGVGAVAAQPPGAAAAAAGSDAWLRPPEPQLTLYVLGCPGQRWRRKALTLLRQGALSSAAMAGHGKHGMRPTRRMYRFSVLAK